MPLLACATGLFDVRVSGPPDAPPVLLSNSLSCDMTMWDAQAAAWQTRFRVIRYDGRGQGASVVSPAPLTLAQLGQDAVAILDSLGVAQAHVCGLSMGGMVAMWLLTHAPHRVGRAVLANTAAHMGPPALWDGRIALARTGGMAATVEPTVQRWFPPAFHAAEPGEVERMRRMIRATPLEGYIAACTAIRDMDQRTAIRTIVNPTLVLIGANDPATTPAAGALIHEAIAGSQTLTLEAGHISNIEQPAAFTAAVAGFLAG